MPRDCVGLLLISGLKDVFDDGSATSAWWARTFHLLLEKLQLKGFL
jgi:hypothetical protein